MLPITQIHDPVIPLLDGYDIFIGINSALDSEFEKIGQVALNAEAKGQTNISVAHRLSKIQNAKIIYRYA